MLPLSPQELAVKGDVDAVIADNIAAGRLRLTEGASSVLVRLCDWCRQGQLEEPAYTLDPANVKLPK